MKNRRISTTLLIFAVFHLLPSAQALADTFLPSSGSISLLATGLDASLQANPNNLPIFLTFEGGLTLFQQEKSVTSFGAGSTPNGLNFAATFKSSAFIKAFDGSLGIRLEGSGEGGWAFSPMGGGEASVTWTDEISLVQRNTGQVPIFPSSSLLLNYRLEGALNTSINNLTSESSGVDSSASVSISVLSEDLSFSVNKNARFNPTGEDLTIFPTLSAEAILDSNGVTNFSTTLSVTARSSWGFGIADFGNTLSFESVTFLDGTTPESHGYDVVFASGIQSPNLTNVPSNQAPNGTINTPANNIEITVGQTVNFTATGSDSNNNQPLQYLWTFGVGSEVSDSTVEDPGNVPFNKTGVYAVVLTVTDSLGLTDPSPSAITVTVSAPFLVSSTPIPTLSEWSIIILIIILFLVGFRETRRA